MKTPEQLFDEIVAGEIRCPGRSPHTPMFDGSDIEQAHQHGAYHELMACLKIDLGIFLFHALNPRFNTRVISYSRVISDSTLVKHSIIFCETLSEFKRVLNTNQTALMDELKHIFE